jgi:hypothetical protein
MVAIAAMAAGIPGGAACAVCGSREVRIDAVEQGGESRAATHGRVGTRTWLLLAECPRCDHRWTQCLTEPALMRALRVAAAPEVANAA